MEIYELLKKSRDANPLSTEELAYILSFPPDSAASCLVMSEADRLSRELSDGHAEIHEQLALNLAPCPSNCLFCSFAKVNNIFSQSIELTPEEAVAYAKLVEREGANAIFVMTTATYPFERFIEISQEIKRNLKPETTLVANVGDQSIKNAGRLKDIGYTGVYHALRLGEGKDTSISPEKRKASIRNFQEAGLKVGTCVEPIGPEHSNEELADMILFTASIHPVYSGAARRVAIPNTSMASRGMISVRRMAQIAAVTRLGMPRTVMGNCIHEPCGMGAVSGANLFWAEVGANPRDTKARTEEGRGETVHRCIAIFREAGWSVWNGPSRYYHGRHAPHHEEEPLD